MTGIVHQAMFMPVRLRTSFIPVSNSRFARAAPVPDRGLQSRQHRWTSPGLVGRSTCLFENLRRQADALADDRVMLGTVLFDQDARLGTAQHRAEAALVSSAIAQIFPSCPIKSKRSRIAVRAAAARRRSQGATSLRAPQPARLPAVTDAESVTTDALSSHRCACTGSLPSIWVLTSYPSGLLRTFVSWGISEHAMVLQCEFEPWRSWTRQNLRSEWIWVAAVPWGPVRFAYSKRLRRPGRFHRQAERLACPTGVPGCW
jgi:hypothetical protein